MLQVDELKQQYEQRVHKVRNKINKTFTKTVQTAKA
jgi:ElaB/YqjD/DUF883 family membrane-anchored ribosome-binding protein